MEQAHANFLKENYTKGISLNGTFKIYAYCGKIIQEDLNINVTLAPMDKKTFTLLLPTHTSRELIDSVTPSPTPLTSTQIIKL